MNLIRLTAALACTALVAISCSRQDDTAASAANPLLGFVPSDTPYVFANLEPVPAETVDAWLIRMEPFLVQAQAHLAEFRVDLDSGHAEIDESFADVARAVMNELDGKLNRAGLESMGLSLESMHAIYGNGLFPVARFGLKDAQALRDTIARIEAASGQSIPEYQFGGTSYWKISDDEEAIAGYIAILSDHVAFSAAPTAAEAEFLPVLLGQDLPANSLADSGALAELNRDKGFLPYGSGYMNLAIAAEELLDGSSRTAIYLSALGEYDATTIDPSCAAEARLVTSYVPRMAVGTTELTPDSMGMAYHMDLKKPLAAELVDLVADVPTASDSSQYLIAAALGLRVGALREMLLEKANAMTAQPFQCPQLQDLNQQVQQLAVQMNQPMPPFIGNLKGFRAVMEEIDPANLEPENVRGMFSLEVESPQMLIGMASMFVPGFEELDIQPGGDPVLIPEELMSVVTPEFEVYAVMTNDAIGLSLGKGQRLGLADFMELEEDNDGIFLSMEYDMAAMAAMERESDYDHGEVRAEKVHMRESHRELAEAYKAMLGRSRVEFIFTDDGLVIDSHMSFK